MKCQNLFFIPRKQDLNFMQIVSIEDNLHEMSKLFSGKDKKNISVCRLLKILHRVLSINSSHIVLKLNKSIW